ncbi:MAG: hypothetical protein HFJ40_05155, partial [Clostridia bacterium]|nr:hypothetical protein [Clostridia bacterium]
SDGYGLIRDKAMCAQHSDIASTASVGYGLAALIIGVKRGWISYEKAYKRVNRTLDTFLKNVEVKNGFYYHFINMNSGKREWNCEISIIDTAIFICGAIVAGEFFQGEVKEKAEELYTRINWEWYRNKENNYFYMGYKPENGFWGQWDMYAEQLMLYVLGVASPTFPINKEMYYNIKKEKADYGEIKDIIYTYCGTLFTYQFSHAWIDFRNTKDKNGIDWFDNSIKATLANRKYCIENSKRFKTFGKDSWGLTACLGPNGYSGGYGSRPCVANIDFENDGTVTPCGAAGSVVFTPELSIKALENYYNNFPKLWGKYGFIDAYNLENGEWYSNEIIGIDKGISMIMIENYLTQFVWKYFMKNKYVQNGLDILNIKKNDKQYENI